MCLHYSYWIMANVISKARMAASARYIYCGEDTFNWQWIHHRICPEKDPGIDVYFVLDSRYFCTLIE